MNKEYDRYADLARKGDIPAGFDQWELATQTGLNVAHVAVMYGQLPADFDQWGLSDIWGSTVAHEAAEHGHLPADFDQWSLAKNDGWTVAHAAAKHGHLPVNFNDWALADNMGCTVAHAAARKFLPPTFNQWAMTERTMGWTVLRHLLMFGRDSKCYAEFLAKWDKEKPACESEIDWDVFKNELPEIYTKRTIALSMKSEVSDDVEIML
jgi:hypothetical protein